MKWLNGYRIRLMLFGFVVVLVIGSSANADFTFGTPTNLGPTVNSSAIEWSPSISADDLELYFGSSDRPGGLGYEDIWVTTRQTIDAPWGPPINLGAPVNSSYRESYPSISSDGLTLYFSDYFWGPDRPGGQGGHDLWMTTRASRVDSWGAPVNLGAPINSSAHEISPTISADGLTLIFASDRGGGSGKYDLWMSTRPTTQDEWAEPVNLGPVVNSSFYEAYGNLSSDGLLLFFESNRPGGLGSHDIWMTMRKSLDEPWGPPVNLGSPVNTSASDGVGQMSVDGKTLYFNSDTPGGFGSYDLYRVSIIPIVDFNGDGIVDAADMCIMVDHWGTNEPLCDIGPMPWGDGVVDVQDLIVLAEHLFTYPGAVSYWKLDETEGTVAHDSVGDYDGTLHGDPVWQPTGGKIQGALQFDGTDDYVSTPFALNPADGLFSVFAWIKGGAPGQVVLSQIDGTNWLCADPSAGNFMTDVRTSGRSAPPLISQTVITDGNWHRVGLVWDGSNRMLYVDDVEVARDTQTGLAGSTGGLHFGAGKNLDAGSFFSGLIDDVRIYNRAVRP